MADNPELGAVECSLPGRSDLSTACGNNHLTLLSTACGNNHLALVLFLLKCDGILERSGFDNATGQIPLHFACNGREPDRKRLVELLLKSGSPVNHRDKWGATPLHYAAFEGNLVVIHVLLDHGANPTLLDTLSMSPADHAGGNYEEECAKFLKEYELIFPKEEKLRTVGEWRPQKHPRYPQPSRVAMKTVMLLAKIER